MVSPWESQTPPQSWLIFQNLQRVPSQALWFSEVGYSSALKWVTIQNIGGCNRLSWGHLPHPERWVQVIIVLPWKVEIMSCVLLVHVYDSRWKRSQMSWCGVCSWLFKFWILSNILQNAAQLMVLVVDWRWVNYNWCWETIFLEGVGVFRLAMGTQTLYVVKHTAACTHTYMYVYTVPPFPRAEHIGLQQYML